MLCLSSYSMIEVECDGTVMITSMLHVDMEYFMRKKDDFFPVYLDTVFSHIIFDFSFDFNGYIVFKFIKDIF